RRHERRLSCLQHSISPLHIFHRLKPVARGVSPPSRLLLATLFAISPPLHGEMIERLAKVRGTIVHFKVVLPKDYDASHTYPAILTLGGGSQTMNTVDSVLNRYFRAEAEKRGYIVVAPAAPDDQLVLWDGSEVFPEFLQLILGEYKIENNKFHI